MYVTIGSPYLPVRGVTGWYQILASHSFSTSRRQINERLICNWSAWDMVIQSNCKYKVIYSFLIILLLNPETLQSFHFSVFHSLWTDSDMERHENHNGPGTSRNDSRHDRDTPGHGWKSTATAKDMLLSSRHGPWRRTGTGEERQDTNTEQGS